MWVLNRRLRSQVTNGRVCFSSASHLLLLLLRFLLLLLLLFLLLPRLPRLPPRLLGIAMSRPSSETYCRSDICWRSLEGLPGWRRVVNDTLITLLRRCILIPHVMFNERLLLWAVRVLPCLSPSLTHSFSLSLSLSVFVSVSCTYQFLLHVLHACHCSPLPSNH